MTPIRSPFRWRSRSPFGGAASGGGGGGGGFLLTTTTLAGWGGKFPTVGTLYPTLRPTDNFDVPVQRIGHLADGTATTYTDNIRVTQRLREKYPNQTTITTEDVVFAEYIRQGDILPAGMTNISTKQYPNGQTCWLQPDHFAIPMTGTFSVDLVVQHPFARNGRPVAAVDIIASDGTYSETIRVTALTFTSYAATGLGVDAFRATFNATNFAEAATVTFNAILYPWRGPSYNLLTQGNPAPNLKNTVIRGYRVPPVYAYVVAGGSGSPQASNVAATAEANPFGDIATARAAIKAFNNSQYTRNELGGGVLRFGVGTWVTETANLTAETPTTSHFIYEAANPANKATTILTDNGATKTNPNIPQRTLIRNLTLNKSVGGVVTIFRHFESHPGAFVLEGCDLSNNGFASDGNWINRLGRCWAINTREVGGGTQTFQAAGTLIKNCISIGSIMSGNCTITRIASRVGVVQCSDRVQVNLGFAQGMHVNNFISGNNASGFIVQLDFALPPSLGGYAMSMNVIERFANGGGSAILWGDGNASHVEDFAFLFNTTPGGVLGNPNNDDTRINSGYSDVAAATNPKHMYFRGNIFGRNARKTDTYIDNTTTGPNGNWPVVMGVDHALNTAVEGIIPTNSVPLWGVVPDNWRFQTVYDRLQIGDGGSGMIVPGYVNDQCRTGGGGGDGDYRLIPASPIQKVPAGWAITARDMLGRAIPDDGSAFIGALPAAA